MTLHAEAGGPGSGLVGADALEASTGWGQLDHRRYQGRNGDGEIHRSRNPEPESAPHPRQTGRGRRRYAGRVPEHRAEKQGVRPERRDDRVETHPSDQEPVYQAGGDGREERDANRGPETRIVAGGVLGHDDDVEGKPARYGEVNPALHDDQRLAERRDRQRRREGQHRQDDALVQAGGCEQPTGGEQQRRRNQHGCETA